MDRFLPYSRQLIGPDDIKAVVDVLSTDLITQGPRIEEFEHALADYVGARYAVSCATGTAALHLSCLALGLGPGKSLVTSPITFLASANCAQYVGAETLFSDIDSDSLCMCIPSLENLLQREKIDVVVPVHFAGHSVEMAELKILGEKYGFQIIEDAAHSLGGEYRGHKIGSCAYSDLAVFSFHPVKHITTGEGGAVTTNDKELYKRLKLFRTHGMDKQPVKFVNPELAYDPNGVRNSWYYEMNNLGFNYRITDIQCALGISQLRKVDRFVQLRQKIADQYKDAFEKNKLFKLPLESSEIKHAYHLYVLRINFDSIGKIRNELMQQLRKLNVGTQVMYIPVHLQPYYSQKYGYKYGDFPNAEKYYEECLSIPIFPSMSDDEVSHVISCVKSVIS